MWRRKLCYYRSAGNDEHDTTAGDLANPPPPHGASAVSALAACIWPLSRGRRAGASAVSALGAGVQLAAEPRDMHRGIGGFRSGSVQLAAEPMVF